nr:endonuclease/exonuclease/phosphatase family protein [Morganella morganii]
MVLSHHADAVHQKISEVYLNNHLVISTWNIQSYEVINSRYGRDMTDYNRFFDLSDFISRSGSHIVCMQECYSGPGASMGNLAVEPYTDSYFGSESPKPDNRNMMLGYFSGNAVISRYGLGSGNTIRIDDEGGYHRVATSNYIDHPVFGNIAIYNIHAGWFENNNTEFYNKIMADYQGKGITKVIICGDFNHDNAEWFSPLFADGFSAANNRMYNTKNSPDGSEWFIDNVLFKGFTMKSAEVYSPDYSLSDHKMLTVTLY